MTTPERTFFLIPKGKMGFQNKIGFITTAGRKRKFLSIDCQDSLGRDRGEGLRRPHESCAAFAGDFVDMRHAQDGAAEPGHRNIGTYTVRAFVGGAYLGQADFSIRGSPVGPDIDVFDTGIFLATTTGEHDQKTGMFRLSNNEAGIIIAYNLEDESVAFYHALLDTWPQEKILIGYKRETNKLKNGLFEYSYVKESRNLNTGKIDTSRAAWEAAVWWAWRTLKFFKHD